MQTEVFITFQLEGMHNWPKAAEVFPDVGFLSHPHRHMFHFRLHKQVNHDDRDVEFIRWKRQVITYLRNTFAEDVWDVCLDFGPRSCEHLAKDLLIAFNCTRVEVSEDGENGAIVTA